MRYGNRAVFTKYCHISCISAACPVNAISQWNQAYTTFTPTVCLWEDSRLTSEEGRGRKRREDEMTLIQREEGRGGGVKGRERGVEEGKRMIDGGKEGSREEDVEKRTNEGGIE